MTLTGRQEKCAVAEETVFQVTSMHKALKSFDE
jgi:hypothetical protein